MDDTFNDIFCGHMCAMFDNFVNKIGGSQIKNQFLRKCSAVGYFSIIASGISIYKADDPFREAFGCIASTACSLALGGLLIANPISGAGILATMAIACVGYYVGEIAKWAYDGIKGFFSSFGEKNCAGLNSSCLPGGGPNGSGGPGGVEFKNIKAITGIQSANIVISKTTNIFFETEFENDVRMAFNSICLQKFRNRKIIEYFDTIMREASDGLKIVNQLPFVSLHFNKNHLLYSVMPTYYKNTLIGNILAFMDYYLKGFVNGGFFTVDFVKQWVKLPINERLTDVEKLNKNLVDVRKSLKKVSNCSGYKSLYDLIDTKMITEFTSAFRIIGELKSIDNSEDIFFPNAGFNVEHDLKPSPFMQMQIDMKNEIGCSFNLVSMAYFKMKDIVKELMPKVPEFRGFFAILDMVTFALHLASSLHSIGKECDCKNSFQIKSRTEDYVNIIPEVFPPLPVAERIKVDSVIKIHDMIKCLQNSCLDKEIEDVVYGKKEDFSTEGLIEIWNKVEQLYRKKVSQSLKEDSKLYDDDDIHVFDFVSNSIYLLKNTPTFIKKLMSQLLADIEKSQENLKSEKNERKTKRNKWMNSQRSVKLTFNQLELKCKRLIKEIIDHLNSSNNKIDGAFNEKEQQLKDFEKKLLIIPVNQRKQPEHGQALAKIRHDLNEINKFKKVKNNHNNANMKIINEFQNRLTLYSSAAHNFVKTASKLVKNDFISPKSFYLPRPRIVTTQKGGTINGGCLVNFSKVPYIRSTTKSKVQLDEIRSCIKNKNQEYVCCSNGKKGFAISLNIVPLFNDGIALQTDRMKDLVRSNDKFLNNMTTAHLSASLGIVDCLKKLNNRQLNEETSDRKTPAYLACETGNLLSIHTLIDKKVDFSRSLPNGIYPFLVAMANGHHDAAMLLLTDKNVKIGDINRSTETGVGPLQWAIFYNYPDIVKLLLERGASVTDTLQSNGMTPIHLACFHNRIECLFLLLNEKDADYGPSKAGITPLQYAIVHSPNCARFLIKIGKSNLKAKDPRGYTMRDIALMNGQFETAQLLPKGGKLEHLIKQNKNSLNNSINLFKSICYALETGNISNAEKLFKNLSKRSEKTVFNREQKKKMIENACLGRKPEFVELLSKVMNFNYYPIALYAARHGLVDWILEIQKYGGNLLCEEDGETIFDIAVENSDHEFLTKAFKIIEKIPEKIIIRIVKRSIKINDDKTIYAISNSLLPEMKNYCLLSPSVILIRETTPYAYFIYQQNLDTKIKLNLNDFVESLSPNLISFLLSQCEFDDEDLKISCLKALNDSRSDIAYVIIQKNPSLVDKIAKDKRYLKITSLTTDNLL